jgi:hypothetical protein
VGYYSKAFNVLKYKEEDAGNIERGLFFTLSLDIPLR